MGKPCLCPGRVLQDAPGHPWVAPGLARHPELRAHGAPGAAGDSGGRGSHGWDVHPWVDGTVSSWQAEEVQQQIIRDTFHLVLKRDDHICNFLECGRYRPVRGHAGLSPHTA